MIKTYVDLHKLWFNTLFSFRFSPPGNFSSPQQPFLKQAKPLITGLTTPDISPNNTLSSPNNSHHSSPNHLPSPTSLRMVPNTPSPQQQPAFLSNMTPSPSDHTLSPTSSLSPEHLTQLVALTSNTTSVTDKFQSLMDLIKSLISGKFILFYFFKFFFACALR